MTKMFRLLSALLLGLSLCGARCERDEPVEAPQRPPQEPPEVADTERDPRPEPDPEGELTDEQWLAMAAEAGRATELELYYADYRVYCRLRGALDSVFGARGARYLMVVGYEGSGRTFTRYPAEFDRWNLFFAEHGRGLELVETVRRYEEEGAARPLYPEEEAFLASCRAELEAEERAALAELRLVLLVEVSGRRLPIDTIPAGTFIGVPPPPPGWSAAW